MMSGKDVSSIRSMGGIDTRFSKDSSRFSDGKNFYTKSGSLYTRPGTTIVPSELTSPVISIINAPLPGKDTVLIVQQGNKLWHLVDDTWTEKYTLTSDKPLESCRFINKILMTNSIDRIAYDIPTGVYSTLVVAGLTEIPALEYFISWKFRVFGWSPSAEDSHMLHFCGYDEDDAIDPKIWPPTFTLNIGGSSGSPIFAAFPSGNHILVLTETTYTPVYGNTEEDFEVGTAGQTNVLKPGVVQGINDLILWLGKDVNSNLVVNLYSGTEPIVISDPIQDFIPDIDLDTVFTKVFMSQFWVICPDSENDKTKVFIYDTVEKEWFIYEFPFEIVSGTVFGEYLSDDYIYLGSSSNVIKFDQSVKTDIVDYDIVTSFSWGSITENNQRLKPKTIYVVAEPNVSFDLGVVQVIDDNPEPESVTLSFTKGTPVRQVTEFIRVSRDKGYNLSYVFSTTDKIDKINGLTAVYKVKGAK